ncbi:capsular polysaccharide transport system permease protein [Loktanella atrilutea]|uniref:Capsular polysaccharide transport system permease protein n=1 Tax=Loktanella atrilutea TaxID=366533 RepID=A0A1M5ELE6_LOKAT|nr:sugar transporter [Loktanella atrilutea]SHF80006.1 capsular polysaccharide transport system permease protein [Loktanella atrilutea]
MTDTTTDDSTPRRRALREAAPFAGPARGRRRHRVLALSFVVMVLLPILASGFYLYTRAADQYASTLGFTVRSEDGTSASDLLGGLSASLGGGGSASDANILYEFIRSQEIVRKVGATLDLEQMYTRHADTDPLLSYSTNGTIEDLTDYWQRMVRISYDNTTGLTELTVLAFDPADARQIAEAIYAESSRMINALSDVVRDDATRYAQQDLDLALERLKTAREALTAFRLANQIVDPNADIQTQMGLLSTLQTQQANALIEFEQLRETASSTDPRLDQARRKLAVIEQLIAAERQKFGKGGGGEDGVEYARTISDFERLTVEREYAETTYAAALAALDGARAAASRQSLYLAAYITPTLAEKSEYPQRGLILGLLVLFSLLIWSIACLIYYALRDRR